MRRALAAVRVPPRGGGGALERPSRACARRYATHHVQICCFQQSCFPRMDAETLLPVPICPFSPETADDWCAACVRRALVRALVCAPASLTRKQRPGARRYPPGHGDVYRSLCNAIATSSDIARVFEGKEYIFISNVDNLGAVVRGAARTHPLPRRARGIPRSVCIHRVANKQYAFANASALTCSTVGDRVAQVDLNILYHMMNEELQFVMEVRGRSAKASECCLVPRARSSTPKKQVTNRTRADIKGGILVEYEGRARMLEAAEASAARPQQPAHA